MLKDFEKETARIYEDDAEKINAEYKKKYDDCVTQRRIDASEAINKSRLSKMQAREKAMAKVYNELQVQLLNKITSDQAYYEKIL